MEGKSIGRREDVIAKWKAEHRTEPIYKQQRFELITCKGNTIPTFERSTFYRGIYWTAPGEARGGPGSNGEHENTKRNVVELLKPYCRVVCTELKVGKYIVDILILTKRDEIIAVEIGSCSKRKLEELKQHCDLVFNLSKNIDCTEAGGLRDKLLRRART